MRAREPSQTEVLVDGIGFGFEVVQAVAREKPAGGDELRLMERLLHGGR